MPNLSTYQKLYNRSNDIRRISQPTILWKGLVNDMKQLLVLFMVILVMISTTGGFTNASETSQGNEYGRTDPYELRAYALKGQHTTDLHLQVSPKVTGYLPPKTLEKVQLKSFSTDEKLKYVRNYNHSISSPGGMAMIQLDDTERYQPIKTQVSIHNEESVSTKILEADTQVLLRPDLIVDYIESPPEAYVNTPFTVTAAIRETNLDVGAKAKVSILEDMNLLDSAEHVEIPAGSVKPVSFLLTISKPGTYTLRASISEAAPGEYDTANNETAFTVKIIEPNKPMNYISSYKYTDYSYNYEGNYTYSWLDGGGYSDKYLYRNTYEEFRLQATTPDLFTIRGGFEIQLNDTNGTLQQWNLSNIPLKDMGNGVKQDYRYHLDTNSHLWITQTAAGTTVSFLRTAGHYHYSYNWKSLQSRSYIDTSSYGQFMNASDFIEAHFELESDEGVSYGGTYKMKLKPGANTAWDYSSGWSGWYRHYWGWNKTINGYSSGATVWE
jgi:hypothetical protein